MKYELIRDQIKEHDKASCLKILKYEKSKCWSYAYLSRWVVLESGLKLIFDEKNKLNIRALAEEWVNYLDGKSTSKPDNIKNFTLQTQTIPPYSFLQNIFGTCNNIKKALDSNEKYRPKRNRIAHKAEEFRSEKDYLEYKGLVDKAIKQMITKLSQKANLIG
tara:strand:- start:82 stop:567 length:486 start_codon:yes stop_codon:yes gene_type:complete